VHYLQKAITLYITLKKKKNVLIMFCIHNVTFRNSVFTLNYSTSWNCYSATKCKIKTLFELFDLIRVAINYTSSRLRMSVVTKLVNLKIAENKLVMFLCMFKIKSFAFCCTDFNCLSKCHIQFQNSLNYYYYAKNIIYSPFLFLNLKKIKMIKVFILFFFLIIFSFMLYFFHKISFHYIYIETFYFPH